MSDRGGVPAASPRIPTREPIHEVDRQRARLERRLALGGFSILLGLAVLFLVVKYGPVSAIVGGVIILGGAITLAVLWLILTAMEWWANKPPADDA